jgi:hypothetical protein
MDRVGEAHVGVADHRLDPKEAALFERANELAPEALGFSVSHLDAEQLASTIGIVAHGHHHSPGADQIPGLIDGYAAGVIEQQIGGLGSIAPELHATEAAAMPARQR